jgi:DNA-binding NarL/FixJ family response regulator
LLFLENRTLQAEGLSSLLRYSSEWQMIHCRSGEEVWSKLERGSNSGELPDVVSLDLGIDDLPESPERGLALLEKIKSRWQGLPIIIHSMLDIHEPVIRKVVSQGASFFWLRDKAQLEEYIQILPFVANGFLIYSQKPALLLPRVVSQFPDPFFREPNYWKTLELLEKGYTYLRIANTDPSAKTERGIQNRVKTIVNTLIGLGEIPDFPDPDNIPSDAYKQAAVQWYRSNKHRYISTIA